MRLTFLLAFLCCSVCMGCNKQPKVAAPASAAPAVQPASVPSAPDPPPASAGQTETAADPKPAPDSASSPPKREIDNAYTANKVHRAGETPQDEIVNEELHGLRGKAGTEDADFGTEVNLDFNAKLSSVKGAQLCDLTFELREDEHGNTAQVTMTDKQRDVAATLEVGDYKLKFKPHVGPGTIIPIGSGKYSNRAVRTGNYDVVVLDHNGKEIGDLVITPDSTIMPGPGVKGYDNSVRVKPDEETVMYTISRINPDRSTTHLVKLRWDSSGTTTRKVSDAAGNSFEYTFPAGSFQVVRP